MSKESLEAMNKLNTHRCKDCGKEFINFQGINEHVKETGHHEFNLVDSDLLLCVGGLKTSTKYCTKSRSKQ